METIKCMQDDIIWSYCPWRLNTATDAVQLFGWLSCSLFLTSSLNDPRSLVASFLLFIFPILYFFNPVVIFHIVLA
jgi:hypothetical protein